MSARNLSGTPAIIWEDQRELKKIHFLTSKSLSLRKRMCSIWQRNQPTPLEVAMSLSLSRITKASQSLSWRLFWTPTMPTTLLPRSLMPPKKLLNKFNQMWTTKKDSQGTAPKKGMCLKASKRRQNSRTELEGARKIWGLDLLLPQNNRMNNKIKGKDTAKSRNTSKNSTSRKPTSNIKRR